MQTDNVVITAALVVCLILVGWGGYALVTTSAENASDCTPVCVIEGVQYATGQVVLHWLTPVPRGSIAIFESLSDFKKVHVSPHPDNKTIITLSDGRQEEF